MNLHAHRVDSHACSCCSEGLRHAWEAVRSAGVSRRSLLLGAGTAAVGTWFAAARTAAAQEAAQAAAPAIRPASRISVQPVLAYATPQRHEQTSWRPWGGIQTAADAQAEMKRIGEELAGLVKQSGLAVDLLPVCGAAGVEEARAAAARPCDVMLVYAAGGGQDILDTLLSKNRPNIVFLRHRSGPVSLWYEILHPHFMRHATDDYQDKGITLDDVVVDEYADLQWRLRALVGLRRTLGQRIVALGGPMGWGLGNKVAPGIARDTWHLDIVTVTYEDLAGRLEKLRGDAGAVAAAARQAGEYLAGPGVSLHTDRAFVDNAMLLYRAFKDMLEEHQASAFTIGHCMGTVMPISRTTACLPLTLLNDEGLVAFCESDFVVIPAGLLMHHITGLPPFLNDPTWPHHGVVTLAHCTSPRKMNGRTLEPVKIYTHFESDYGAAPKVEMTVGQEVTMVVPDFENRRWVGARGRVQANPFHDICRAQIDVAIEGRWEQLVRDMRGFHWMLTYGDCLKEVGYAIRHLGIEWTNVSA